MNGSKKGIRGNRGFLFFLYIKSGKRSVCPDGQPETLPPVKFPAVDGQPYEAASMFKQDDDTVTNEQAALVDLTRQVDEQRIKEGYPDKDER